MGVWMKPTCADVGVQGTKSLAGVRGRASGGCISASRSLLPPRRLRRPNRKRAGIVTQYQSKQEEKDGHHKTTIWTQRAYELKNYLRSCISQPRYSTGCRSNTSGAITVRSKPH